MSFICSKCDKIFTRNIDLIRHNNRKIPCDRKLECNRCFKIFSQKCDLLNHINRKNKCYDRRSEMELRSEIKAKENELKDKTIIELDKENENLKLKLKLKELELKLAPKKKPNINIYNQYININIGDFKEIHIKIQDVDNLISNSEEEIIKKLSKLMFNNNAHPNNRCLVSYNGNVFGVINGQFHEYMNIVPHVNMLFQKQCGEISKSLEDNEEKLKRRNKKMLNEYNYKNHKIKTIPDFINNESERIIEPSLKKL